MTTDFNAAEWNALREGIRKSNENTLKCFAENENRSEETVGCYHLGAIRRDGKAVYLKLIIDNAVFDFYRDVFYLDFVSQIQIFSPSANE